MTDNFEHSLESLGKNLLEYLSTSDTSNSNKNERHITPKISINTEKAGDSLKNQKEPIACCVHSDYYLYYFTCKELNKKV